MVFAPTQTYRCEYAMGLHVSRQVSLIAERGSLYYVVLFVIDIGSPSAIVKLIHNSFQLVKV